MNDKTITIDKSIFKSKLIPIATVFCTLASFFSIITVIKFFDPQSMIAIKSKYLAYAVGSASAIYTYTFIYILFSVICLITSIVLSIGLILIVLGQTYNGLNFLHHSYNILYYVFTGAGVVTALYFIYKLIKYFVETWQINHDALAIVASLTALIWEGLLFAVVVICFLAVRNFLYSCTVTTISINYTVSLNKLNAPSIPPLSILGFLIFGIADFFIAIDRLILLSHDRNEILDGKYILITPVHMQQLSSIPFILAGIGSILIYIYLRFYKQKAERLLNVTIKDVLK